MQIERNRDTVRRIDVRKIEGDKNREIIEIEKCYQTY